VLTAGTCVVCLRPASWLRSLETCVIDTWKTQFIGSRLLATKSVVNVKVFSWLESSPHSQVDVDCFGHVSVTERYSSCYMHYIPS